MVIMVGIIALCLIASPAFATLNTLDLGTSSFIEGAEGVLQWQSVATSFTGNLTVAGLDPGYEYQLKIEQDWTSVGGSYLSQIGRTWNNTGVYNFPDDSTDAERQARADAGDELVGYFLFSWFTMNADGSADYVQDGSGVEHISPNSDGSLTLPFYADYSWHVAGQQQNGREWVTGMPMGEYDSQFLLTREPPSGWAYDNIFGKDGVAFSVAKVPEPSTLLLLGGGLLGLAGLRRKFKI